MNTTLTATSTPTIRLTVRDGFTYRQTWNLWKGQPIEVENSGNGYCCDDYQHNLGVVHHGEPDGSHMCPTGVLICHHCGAIAKEPEPYSCLVWDLGPEMKEAWSKPDIEQEKTE